MIGRGRGKGTDILDAWKFLKKKSNCHDGRKMKSKKSEYTCSKRIILDRLHTGIKSSKIRGEMADV
ncbi:MAG: hypothetical protein COV65_07140 [Nitrosopumilales archaeon CG11_big_fil_rev_8_21_14_0_20_33_24]|nr:MAG: hypothetical protein COV65_07140 [Nitrosopumilales archaeon CG11_big_fil_rev_8_21_14_0_20_33_24]